MRRFWSLCQRELFDNQLPYGGLSLLVLFFLGAAIYQQGAVAAIMLNLMALLSVVTVTPLVMMASFSSEWRGSERYWLMTLPVPRAMLAGRKIAVCLGVGTALLLLCGAVSTYSYLLLIKTEFVTDIIDRFDLQPEQLTNPNLLWHLAAFWLAMLLLHVSTLAAVKTMQIALKSLGCLTLILFSILLMILYGQLIGVAFTIFEHYDDSMSSLMESLQHMRPGSHSESLLLFFYNYLRPLGVVFSAYSSVFSLFLIGLSCLLSEKRFEV